MRESKDKYGCFLDRIIDKYSATPKVDPEFINYASRPTREAIRERQVDLISGRYQRGEGDRGAEQTL